MTRGHDGQEVRRMEGCCHLRHGRSGRSRLRYRYCGVVVAGVPARGAGANDVSDPSIYRHVDQSMNIDVALIVAGAGNLLVSLEEEK